jgi:hypothetical protein
VAAAWRGSGVWRRRRPAQLRVSSKFDLQEVLYIWRFEQQPWADEKFFVTSMKMHRQAGASYTTNANALVLNENR